MAFADEKLKVAKLTKFLFDREENIAAKEENAECFQAHINF